MPGILLAQNKPDTYDIKHPGPQPGNKCQDYLNIFERLPVEARYGLEIEDGIIYFIFPSQYFFELLFDKKTDGIAVDIIRRDQFKCYQKNSFTKSWANRGYLLPPIYKEEMLKNSIPNELGYVLIKYGKLPDQFDPLSIECNLLVLQKKYLCRYHAFSNLEYTNWDLLEMGMYRDSISSFEIEQKHYEVTKTLNFEIPFERNKDVFEISDIQPLYDSLRLTDYFIEEISIKAYTSVEGSLDRNIQLQNDRAKSIVKALQTYQQPEIETYISANENWVEFLNDITDTRFSHLINLSKEEIKAELAKDEILKEIEPILMHHRKALVQLKLQKRFTSEENDPEVLKTYFDQNIQSKNISEAIYIQDIIFEKIRDNQLPSDFIGKLEVPEESLYGPLLNNLAIFNYESNDIFLYENIMNFEKLLAILPQNIKVQYNLTALKIKAWTEGELITNKEDILKSIQELERNGLEKSLVTRLKVNYHIILTQYNQINGDYKSKNSSLKQVYWLYSRLNLSDQDLLSLSKYLAVYSKFDWAESILGKRIHDLDVDENLIFYYIRLTINQPKKTKQSAYRKFLLNAIDKNSQRFCDLFLPTSQGGYTFQLLDDEYLRKNYCENCYTQ